MVRPSRLFPVIPAQAGMHRLSLRESLKFGICRNDGYRVA
jgi:hypothetical protein